MTTKNKTPEALRAQAEKLAQQAAEVQAELDAHTLREWEAEQAEQRKADEAFLASFDAAALDAAVDQARERLAETVAQSPIVQAHADYLAAQYIRNHAHVDLTQARDRLGLPATGARQAGTTDTNLQELIDTTTQREAQRRVQAHRGEQA